MCPTISGSLVDKLARMNATWLWPDSDLKYQKKALALLQIVLNHIGELGLNATWLRPDSNSKIPEKSPGPVVDSA
jgi:hypothetical protein